MRVSAGYTLVELLLVVAVIAILAALSLSAFVTLYGRSSLAAIASGVLADLEEARSLAMNGKNGDAWGVHLASSSVTLFEGTVFSAGGASNVVTTLDPSVTIASTSLSGGGTDVVFSPFSGQTSQSGTITLSLVASSSIVKTITVYQTGLSSAQ